MIVNENPRPAPWSRPVFCVAGKFCCAKMLCIGGDMGHREKVAWHKQLGWFEFQRTTERKEALLLFCCEKSIIKP